MKFIAENAKVVVGQDQFGKKKVQLVLNVAEEGEKNLLDSVEYLVNAKKLKVEVDREYEHRSLNANAMFWVMCQLLAQAIGGSNEETYLRLLEDYGVIRIVTVDEEGAADLYSILLQNYRKVEILGRVLIGGKPCFQFKCFVGSHAYNTKQMSRLLDGVLQECRELGIPTEVPSEVERAKQEWDA